MQMREQHVVKLIQELAFPAREVLVKNLVVDLFLKYQIQPREMALRGQDVSRRLSRIAPLLDNPALAALNEDPLFQKSVAEWRAKMNEAYGALLDSKEPVSPFFIALVYTAMGDKDDAFLWLDKAVTERSGSVRYLKIEPRLDPLRSDPRFDALLQRVGLKGA